MRLLLKRIEIQFQFANEEIKKDVRLNKKPDIVWWLRTNILFLQPVERVIVLFPEQWYTTPPFSMPDIHCQLFIKTILSYLILHLRYPFATRFIPVYW